MTGLDTDLATLRGAIRSRAVTPLGQESINTQYAKQHAALDRVEAELARLREERDDLAEQVRLRDLNAFDGASIARVIDARDAAEAECARLREELDAALRDYVARDRYDALSMLFLDMAAKRDAAEARCARLESELRSAMGSNAALQQALAEIRDGYDGDEFADSADTVDDHREIARQALSGFPESPGHPMRVRLQRALAEAVLSIEEYAEASGTLIADTSKLRALAGPGSERSSLTESGPAGLPDTPAPRYDRGNHKWIGQCPHGDVCSGCDARGYCTREEGPDTPADAGNCDCGGDGWYIDHEDECYETGDCNCSGVQVECECQSRAALRAVREGK